MRFSKCLLILLAAATPALAADYDYTVRWTNPAQPSGVTLTGLRVNWERCSNGLDAGSADVEAFRTSYVKTLPLESYCWTVTSLSSTNDGATSSPVTFHSAPDTDEDGVLDDVDNCTLVANPTQCDSDADGFGNHCDGDLAGDNDTDAQDFLLFRAQLGEPSEAPVYNVADLNCNGYVNAQDFVLFRAMLGQEPGPNAP